MELVKLVHAKDVSLKEIIHKNGMDLYNIINLDNVTITNKNNKDIVIKIVNHEIDTNTIRDVFSFFNIKNYENEIDVLNYDYIVFTLDDGLLIHMSLTDYMSYAENLEKSESVKSDIYSNVWEMFEVVDKKELEHIEENIEVIPQNDIEYNKILEENE